MADASCPLIQGWLVVAAGVQNFGAVQAAVHEIGSEVHQARPLDGIGANEGDIVLAQKIYKFGRRKAGVADFHGVTQRALGIGFQRGAAGHPFIVLAS